MGARGRKTAAEKVVQLRAIEALGLPQPPEYLNEAAQAEWSEIVQTYPPDRFPRGTWPMLERYCVHAVQARKITALVDAVTAETPLRDYDKLLSMLDRESKAVASFGVRLGIARTAHAGRHNHDPETFAEREGDLPWKE